MDDAHRHNGDRIRNHPMLRDLDLSPLGGEAAPVSGVFLPLAVDAVTPG